MWQESVKIGVRYRAVQVLESGSEGLMRTQEEPDSAA
jgi:hypothetical protein